MMKYEVNIIGYKYAADCIDQYRLYTNSDHLLTQNHANYEWFMIYNSISDVAKENSDMYATLNKIRNHNPYVPGTYIKVDPTKKADQLYSFIQFPICA